MPKLKFHGFWISGLLFKIEPVNVKEKVILYISSLFILFHTS